MAHSAQSSTAGPSTLPPPPPRARVEQADALLLATPTETSPLLPSRDSSSSSMSDRSNDPLWTRLRRPGPMWMAALTVAASIARGMVIAPRVEVYTTLACHNLVPIHHTDSPPTAPIIDTPASITTPSNEHYVSLRFPVDPDKDTDSTDDSNDEPITTIPSLECRKNRTVQAAAARIQYLMTIIMGVLSAVTTGSWGQFGDRVGRRPVMIISAFGLMFVDIVFLLVARPHSAFSSHGHKLLLVAPFVEGLLGGWSTFIAATNAYISDCTDNGSRSKIFSQISGITYIGFAVGPMLGNLWVMVHPSKTTDAVFQFSILLNALNLILLLTAIPESVSDELRQQRQQAPPLDQAKSGPFGTLRSSFKSFVSPLSLFVPKNRGGEVAWSDYKDWNMTCLAVAMLCYLLTVALFQLKYLYASTVYGWAQMQLAYYISVMGWVRALHLLVILPAIIQVFRRRSRRNAVLKQRSVLETHSQDPSDTEAAQASREIHFDLLVVKLSLGFDLLSHLLVTLLHPDSGILFTLLTVPSSLGAGMLPGVQSLALCILRASGEPVDIGKLFGAISVLQAVGSTIIGPTMFAYLFQESVGRWNEAIFALAAGLIFVALAMVSMVRSRKYVIEGTLASVRAHRSHWLREEDGEVGTASPSPAAQSPSKHLAVPVPGGKRRRERERGRSRRSKDLSGSSSVSDSDPSRSLPQAFHRYKLPLQHQESAAV